MPQIKPQAPNSGTLYVVATPIGNLGDLSPRATALLKEVDLIIAEDTRVSRKLLRHFEVNTRIQSYHEHSPDTRIATLLGQLQSGQSIAMISDAGTPMISDPGYPLINAALEAGISLISVPGPSALSAALAVCGLPVDRMAFEGFLPAAAAARRRKLKALSTEQRSMLFFEAPHRLIACVEDMHKVFGADRHISMIREISKIHEHIHRCELAEAVSWLNEDSNRTRGEHVLIVQGATTVIDENKAEQQRILSLLMSEMPLSRAVRLAEKISGAAHGDLYKMALELQATTADTADTKDSKDTD
jgi:16S rRNA (cytidine1402-2'-O)-methyltransferase